MRTLLPHRGIFLESWDGAVQCAEDVVGLIDEGRDLTTSAGTFARRALVIEDEALLAEFVAEILEEFGFAVTSAASAESALSCAREHIAAFEFAILDLGLPDRPGEEVAAELRKLRPDFPIIVATGRSDDETRQRFQNFGEIVFLMKPYSVDHLNNAVNAITQRA